MDDDEIILVERAARQSELTAVVFEVWAVLQPTPLLVFFTNKGTHIKTYKRHPAMPIQLNVSIFCSDERDGAD
jgi:hypothetical protein